MHKRCQTQRPQTDKTNNNCANSFQISFLWIHQIFTEKKAYVTDIDAFISYTQQIFDSAADLSLLKGNINETGHPPKSHGIRYSQAQELMMQFYKLIVLYIPYPFAIVSIVQDFGQQINDVSDSNVPWTLSLPCL